LNGNSGTTSGPNFLGTTDAKDLVFKNNNTESMRITSGGNLGMGVIAPTEKLDILGRIKLDDSYGRSTTLETISFGVGNGLCKVYGGGTNSINFVVGDAYYDCFKVGTSNNTSYFRDKLKIGDITFDISNAQLEVKGTSNNPQVMIDAYSGQTNSTPMIQQRNSSGTVIGAIHTDDATNIFMGVTAGSANNTSGGGIKNLFLGNSAGNLNSTGTKNIYLGYRAGYQMTAVFGNIVIGTETNASNFSGSNQLNIGNTITGDLSTGNIGIAGNLALSNAGKGLQIKEGSNAKMGTAILSSGSVIVSNTSITTSTRIFLTLQNCSSCGTLYISSKTAGTSFTITSTNNTDNSTVAWLLIEPAQ